jgi:hypothetical protein
MDFRGELHAENPEHQHHGAACSEISDELANGHWFRTYVLFVNRLSLDSELSVNEIPNLLSSIMSLPTEPRTWCRDGFIISTDKKLLSVSSINHVFG